jgi:hypothetical protein
MTAGIGRGRFFHNPLLLSVAPPLALPKAMIDLRWDIRSDLY